MSLTGRPPYQKQGKAKKRRKKVRKVSAKKSAYTASTEGQRAREYIAAVKTLPCCICGKAGPSDAHHTICGRYGSRKTSDFDTVPLCKICHQTGPNAIHNGKRSWVERNGPDTDYIAETRRKVALVMGCRPGKNSC